MNRFVSPKQKNIISVLFVFAFFILFWKIGIFKTYAHLFSERHLHRAHMFMRLGSIAVFAVLNYFVFVPQFYEKKRYLPYAFITASLFIVSFILPDIVLKPVEFDPAKLPFGMPPTDFIIPPFAFEFINILALFFISVFGTIAYKTNHFTSNINLKEDIKNAFEDNKTPEIEAKKAMNVTVDYSLVRIEFEDILFIKSMDNYLQFYFKDKKPILVRMTLKEVLDKLPADTFLRAHKSYIVATTAIESIRNKTILIGENEIPIGRTYEASILKNFSR